MIYKTHTKLFLVTCLLLPIMAMSQPMTSDQVDSDRSCGPRCLLAACRTLGISAKLDEITSLCGGSEQGVTLANLYNAAARKGLHAVGMKIGIDELAKANALAIVHQWNQHYVLLRATGDDSPEVIDPSENGKVVPLEKFRDLYSGFALLLSKGEHPFPQADSNPPDLRSDRYACDFGFVDQGTSVDCLFTIRNAGSNELAILDITSTSQALTAALAQDKIPAGGSTELIAHLDTSGLAGGQMQRLFVRSNDPVTPIVHLQCWGVVKPPYVTYSPRKLDFWEVQRGQSPVRQVFLADPGDGTLRVTKVASDSPSLSVVASKQSDGKMPGYLITATLSPDAPAAHIEANIMVTTNHPRNPSFGIPVVADVFSDVTAFPESLVFAPVEKGTSATRAITIRAVDSRLLESVQAESSLGFLRTSVRRNRKSKECECTVVLDKAAAAGEFHGEITIHVPGSRCRDIIVPVHGTVRD